MAQEFWPLARRERGAYPSRCIGITSEQRCQRAKEPARPGRFIPAKCLRACFKFRGGPVFAAGLLVGAIPVQGLAAAGDLDLSFFRGSGINDRVRAVAAGSDGKVLIAGDFTTVHGAVRGRIARLNADGGNDATFLTELAGADSAVYCLGRQSDGRILLGGQFSSVNGAARVGVARLNPEGSLDTTFAPLLGGPAGLCVRCLAIQSDGKIVIGGDFTAVNGVARNGVARLNADGSLDSAFAGTAMNPRSLAVQGDGKIVVAEGGYGGMVKRLNSNGSDDPTFAVFTPLGWLRLLPDAMSGTFPADAFCVAIQSDGKILVGGDFLTRNTYWGYAPPPDQVPPLVRLKADGSLDSFQASLPYAPQGCVMALAVQSDSKILVAGMVDATNGVVQEGITRLEANGERDASFLARTPKWVSGLSIQSDGKILVAGDFDSVEGAERVRVARLEANGVLDSSFINPSTGMDQSSSAIAVAGEGKVLVGGGFTRINGVSQPVLARLGADGIVDGSFTPAVQGAYRSVCSIALQADGKVLIGGTFTAVNGVVQSNLARLNANGSLDTAFTPLIAQGALTAVYSTAVQSDGKVVVGGLFTLVNGVALANLARLNADGSLDGSFAPRLDGMSSYFHKFPLALQPDGKILISAGFTAVNGVARTNLARLNPDGSLDMGFLNNLSGPSDFADAIAVQPDGKILLGGLFCSVNGVSRTNLARLNADGSLDTSFLPTLAPSADGIVNCLVLQPDGKILVGGAFPAVSGVTRNNLVRLNADGSVDRSFLPSAAGPDGGVNVLALQLDGGILIAGYFGTVHGRACNYLARLLPNGPPYLGLARDANGQSWFSAHGEPGRTAVLQASADLQSWTPVATNILANIPVTLTDPQDTPSAQRFYRLQMP